MVEQELLLALQMILMYIIWEQQEVVPGKLKIKEILGILYQTDILVGPSER